MSDEKQFRFEGQGTLLRIDTFVTKANKSILTLIFETHGQYPQTIPIKVFGQLAERAHGWSPGTVLSVSGRLGGRDYQGKVYGECVAESVEVIGAAQLAIDKRADETAGDLADGGDVPF
jgi:single-stranded DNA-binding protein